MSASEPSDHQPSRKAAIPRWVAPIYVIAGTLVVHVVMPWAISLIGPRTGWADGRPGLWNWLGLIPVAAGLGMIGWGARLHFVAAPGGWQMERAPHYMLLQGPYRFSRNPMYVLELVMWLGWAIFYGSLAVLVALILMWVIMAFAMVPREERDLEARFGETYRQYKNSVPRWFGLPRRQ